MIFHIRNLRQYAADFGLVGALQLAFSKRFGSLPEYAVKPIATRHSLFVRRNSSDFLVLRQVLSGKAYASVELQEPKLIIDAGANVGYTSALLATRFPNCRIDAVEPDLSNYQQLVKNTCNYTNIAPRNAAVWPSRTKLTIQNPADAEWEFRMVESPDGVYEGIPVEDIIDASGQDYCDLLKLDIEGGEFDLLAKNTDRWLPRVRILMVELHDRIRPGCTEKLQSAIGHSARRDIVLDEYRVIYF